MGSGTGVSRSVSSTMFLTVTERKATSFSTSKRSSCFDFSLTMVDSARAQRGGVGLGGGQRVDRRRIQAALRCTRMAMCRALGVPEANALRVAALSGGPVGGAQGTFRHVDRMVFL